MIETIDGTEYGLPEEIVDEGSKLWPYALLPTSSCIFFVTFVQKRSAQGFTEKRIACFSDPRELVKFCESTLYTAVRVMSPGQINKTGDWQIDDLVEIWQAEEPDVPDIFVRIYVTQNKTQYSDSHVDTPTEELINKELTAKFIFKNETGITNSYVLQVCVNMKDITEST